MNILNRLTIKHLLLNKKRTIVTIVGVLLSTALMVGIGLLFSSIRDNSVKTVVNQLGGQHVTINRVKDTKLDIIEHNNKIKKISIVHLVGFVKIENPINEGKPYLYIGSGDTSFFSTLKLKKGRLPKNNHEIVISNHMQEGWNIGDTVTLNLVNRLLAGETLLENASYDDEELTQSIRSQSYKIVGLIERPYSEAYSAAGYSIFTTNEQDTLGVSTVYLNYKNVKSVYSTTDALAKQLGLTENKYGDFDDVSYNTSLLALSGVSRYDNFLSSLATTIIIILFLISIGCIVVIYNSFSISVMERKKQFGLFSSIGATKLQLRKTVFFEAIIVGVIGIPLGILSGFLGIGIVLQIINNLLPNLFGIPLALASYPLFLIIPILFMITVILVSAYLPAKKASRITPIEAIRQNDDIKIKSNKIKTPRIVGKVFGVEGEIALKNMKRNKKKYRITIASLFISIVLFVSFSGLLDYGLKSAYDYSNLPEYDLSLTLYQMSNKEQKNWISAIKEQKETKKIMVYLGNYYASLNIDLKKYYTKRALTLFKDDIENDDVRPTIFFYVLDDASYKAYQQQIGLSETRPIVINRLKGIIYSQNTRTSEDFKLYNSLPDKISFCQDIYSKDNQEEIDKIEEKCNYAVENFFMTEEYPLGLESNLEGNWMNVILNEEMAKSYQFVNDNEQYSRTIYVSAPKNEKLADMLETMQDQLPSSNQINYYNVQEDLKLAHNMILVVKILLYGFITLVTLIGVTSVFNTINTSISLRRKEFAMLRSMGLTPHGFNKIIYFESLFFGLKSLFYALPVSIGVIYLLGLSFGEIIPRDMILIPWKSILFATFGVFMIVLCSMMYASKKVKKENILNAIREENI